MEKALKTKRILDNKKATQDKMGEQGAAKHDVGLIVSDIDGTITNFWKMAMETADMVMDKLVESRQKMNPEFSRETLEKQILDKGNKEFYMHNLPRMLKQLPCLEPRNAAERKAFARDDAKIVHDWEKMRAEYNKPFKGFMQTLNKHKAAGGKFVAYTDSPMSSTLARLQLMGLKPEQIDGIYSQPDDKALKSTPDRKEPEKGPLISLNSKQQKWLKELGDKVVELPPHTDKPNPEVFAQICKDMGVPPKNAIMVGDMPNDIGTVKGTGAISVWQEQGVDDIDKRTIDIFNKLQPIPNYHIGREAVEAKFASKGMTPDVSWKNGFSDFSKHFRSVDAKTLQPPVKAKELPVSKIVGKKALSR